MVIAAEPPLTPKQIKHYEEVVKPQIERAVRKLPRERVERAAELGGETAAEELRRREAEPRERVTRPPGLPAMAPIGPEPSLTPKQLKHYEEVVKPQIEAAIKKLPRGVVETAAELGGKMAAIEIERRKTIPIVVGALPAEDLVIVKDPYTGETYYKLGTPEQIAEVSKLLDVPGAVLPDILYVPPAGIDFSKPVPGSLAEEPGRRGPVTIYDYKGLPIELTREQATDLYELKGKEQFSRMMELGVLQEGSEFVPGLTKDEWAYHTPTQVKATERFKQSLKDISPELYEVYEEGGYAAYEAALAVEYKKLPWAYDYEASKFVKVPWEAYEARGEFYEQFPMIGPPGTPGAMTPAEAQQQYEEFQTKLKSGEVITVGNGEYAHAESKGRPDSPGYILGYNDMPENWQDYANKHGMTALTDKLQTEASMPYTVSGLDKIMTEGTWHEKSYVNSVITAAGLLKPSELVGPGAPPPLPKKWEDLSAEEKQAVADIYEPPGTWIAEATKWLEEWGGAEKPTLEKVDRAVHDMGIIGENRAIAGNIAKAMIDADVPVSAISPRGTKVPIEEVAESWGNLTSDEKLRVLKHYKTTTERIAEFQVKAAEATEDWLKFWKDEDPAWWREIKALPKGLLEVAQGITVGMGGSILKSFTSLAEGHPKSSVVQLSEIPTGMTQWATIESSKRVAEPLTPGIGLLVGNLAIPIALKGVKATIGGTKTAVRMGETLVKKGVLPRAYKGGGLDVFRVKVPEGFERLTSELDVIALNKAQNKAIFESGLNREQQMAKVRELLTPETRAIYDNYMSLIDEVSKFKTPEGMMREVDFGDVARMPRASADAVKVWMQENVGGAKVHGSFADWVQTKGVEGMWRPNDLDLNILPKSNLTPELAAKQLSDVIRGSSHESVRARGSVVEIYRDGKWTKLCDIHYEGQFGKLPYEWMPKVPIKVEGVLFEQLGEQMFRRGEQIVNPGIGRARGLMGPEAAARRWRLSDVKRFQTEVRGIINVLREQGKVELAGKIERALDFVEGAPKGKPKPLTYEEGAALQREFIELVDELQEVALTRGVDASLEHRLGTLSRHISPAGRELKGTVYHATTNLADYVRTLKEKGYIEAGRYIDEQGNWIKAPREDMFTSPDLAFDRLYDIGKGRIPENAGVVAIRIVAEDIGKGRTASPAFRVEHIVEKGKEPYPVVLDELLFTEGSRAYPTDPTGLSFRKGSTSEGLTGEVATYHPRAKKSISVLYFATEGARKAGLSAPNLTQSRSMNLLAIRAMLADLLHPHLPKRFVATTEPIKGASIIEFYRDTYKWKGKSKAEVAKAVAEQDKILRAEAVENLRKRGKDRLSPEEYTKALDEELSRVASKEVMKALSDKEIQRMLTDFSADEIARTYYLNLKELYSKMAAAGLGGASTTISAITKTDVLTIPTLVSRLTPEVMETIAPSIVPTDVTPVITPTLLVKEIVPTKVITLVPPIEVTKPTIPTEVVTPTIPTVVVTEEITPVMEITEVTEPIIPTPVTVPGVVPPAARPLPLLPSGVTREKRPQIPPGSITWKQGELKIGDEMRPVWKYIPPPFDQPKPITLLAPPTGAKNIDMRTPEETIQQIGEGPVPADISIDLGIADIYISEGGKRIRYEGRGLKTDVGKRIEGTEKGMSVPEAEAPLGLAGLKLGTSFGEYITREPRNEAQEAFMNREVARMMSEMSPEQIASEIRLAGLTEPKYEIPGKGKDRGRGLGVDVNKLKVNRLLEHLPDRVRAEVRRLLRERELEFVSVGRGRYAELRPPWRRVKPVKIKVFKKSEKERKEKKPKKVKPSITELSGMV